MHRGCVLEHQGERGTLSPPVLAHPSDHCWGLAEIILSLGSGSLWQSCEAPRPRWSLRVWTMQTSSSRKLSTHSELISREECPGTHPLGPANLSPLPPGGRCSLSRLPFSALSFSPLIFFLGHLALSQLQLYNYYMVQQKLTIRWCLWSVRHYSSALLYLLI